MGFLLGGLDLLVFGGSASFLLFLGGGVVLQWLGVWSLVWFSSLLRCLVVGCSLFGLCRGAHLILVVALFGSWCWWGLGSWL
jgi:hypothetical protein